MAFLKEILSKIVGEVEGFNLRKKLIEYGFVVAEDENTMISSQGISVRFYMTDSGLEMFNIVDTQKPKGRWMILKFRVDQIQTEDDLLFLLRGSTTRGF